MPTRIRCGVHGCRGGAEYQFESPGRAADVRCRWHGLIYPPTFHRALRVALVVGTILTAINQSDVLLSGHLTPLLMARVGLTYLVPFCVSTYSALAVNLLRRG